MARQKKPARKESESDEEVDSHRSRSRSRSREREHVYYDEDFQGDEQGESQEEEDMSQNRGSSNNESPQKIAIEIRSAFLDFFGNLKNQKGFVFTPQQRSKLQKQQQRNIKKDRAYQVIQWKPECEWSIDEQKIKISNYFERQKLNISEKQLENVKETFLKTSYLFGDETTGELYNLMMAILKICIKFPSLNEQSEKEVRQFIASMRKKDVEYKFFNFKFSGYHKLPEDNSVNVEQVYRTLGNELCKYLHMALFENN